MRFEYIEPVTIQEAVSSLMKYDGKAKVIAGGTDLVVQMRQKTVKPEVVVDITHIPDLDYIRLDEKQGLRIGALSTIRSLEKSEELRRRFPVISSAAGCLGSVAVRNQGTLGGNLCNAAPSAEMAPSLIALSAKAKIVGPEGERVVPLEDFFKGPGLTVLKKGEILVEIQVPDPSLGVRGVYLKHSIRGSIDLAIVGVAVIGDFEPKTKACKDVRIVLGAVAPTPMRARGAEEVLRGKKIKNQLIEESAEKASGESRPITDVRGSEWYRREMVKVLTRQGLSEVLGQIG